jgi:hypothetical protein
MHKYYELFQLRILGFLQTNLEVRTGKYGPDV